MSDRPKTQPCKSCGGTMKWFLGKYVCSCGAVSVPVEKEFVKELGEFRDRLRNGETD